MRWRRRRAWTELERTCLRDGTVWYVQPSTLERPWLLGPAPLRARVADKAYVAGIEARRQAAETCPICGSTDYDERKVVA